MADEDEIALDVLAHRLLGWWWVLACVLVGSLAWLLSVELTSPKTMPEPRHETVAWLVAASEEDASYYEGLAWMAGPDVQIARRGGVLRLRVEGTAPDKQESHLTGLLIEMETLGGTPMLVKPPVSVPIGAVRLPSLLEKLAKATIWGLIFGAVSMIGMETLATVFPLVGRLRVAPATSHPESHG